MATKRYNEQNFHIERANGTTISFYCWTTNTRQGFCHTVWCCDTDQTTKVSYWNRTWECYDYQTALRKAFDKLNKADRDICRLWDAAKENHEHIECEKFVQEFKAIYNETPQELKDRLASSGIHVENQEQAEGLMGLMKLATIMNK